MGYRRHPEQLRHSVNFFHSTGNRLVCAAFFPEIGKKIGDGGRGLVCNVRLQVHQLAVDGLNLALVQLRTGVRQAGGLLHGGLIAGEGGKGGKLCGPGGHGHGPALCRDRTGQVDDIIVWAGHVECLLLCLVAADLPVALAGSGAFF